MYVCTAYLLEVPIILDMCSKLLHCNLSQCLVTAIAVAGVDVAISTHALVYNANLLDFACEVKVRTNPLEGMYCRWC